MQHPKLGIVLCLLLCIALTGCMFGRNKINIEEFNAKAAQIETGKTTAKEATEIIGSPPNAILQLGKGERAYVYTFGDAKTGGLNLIVFNTRKTNTGIDSAYFFLDDNDVIVKKIVSNYSDDLDWDWWPF